ncbi:unnamed protein product [Acanthoscelides obtectus]|uniref:Gelsolin-like domain-containing protein n=1 Tax=Acanthoscelides obtectus TaxID=200917 RepID=A0A9P0K131_ACAOB|nr:unnamed protein product [Acanthoscelides obtectus]CAK1627515.1 Gelsolin [Acanthoscelides obtectus]
MGAPSSSGKQRILRPRAPFARYLLLVLAVFYVETGLCDISRTSWFGRSASPSSAQPQAKRQRTGSENFTGRRTMVEAAFDNAGKTAGVEIWRVEDFKPVRYPKDQYGKFYTGDSYIVLNTKVNKNGQKSYDIHFWLGSETSQDEAGAAAILAVQLDDMLDGVPIQHREVQDHESQLFLSYFKGGVRYLPGGVSSGFHHVDNNAFEKKLFQVKGSRNIRVKQVVPSIASMNDGDCFILDVGRKIYVYVGKKARRVEKLKAINAANQIRDQDHAGKATVTIVGDFEEFFQALGEGSKGSVPADSVGADDQQFESTEERQVGLYRVSDKTGSVQITPVSRKPLDANQLDPQDCFILDTGDANIYVWIGKQCDDSEKRESMKKADEYLKNKNYPKWTHVERIIQNAEPAAFTQYFR